MIEMSSVLCSAHMVPRDQNKFVFYVNNYLNWDQLKQLYDPDSMEKVIRNADTFACKLDLASTWATNQRLEVAREERQKREEMMKNRKTEAMATKWWRARGGINLFSEEKENYESNTRDETDPNQAGNDKNPLQLWEKRAGGKDKWLK